MDMDKPPLFLRFLFRLFVASRWWRSRVTKFGMIIVMSTIFSGVFGLDTWKSLAYQLFSLLFLLLLIASLASLWLKAKVNLKRVLPRYAMINQVIEYQVVIQNLTNKQQIGLSFLEQLPEACPSWQSFSQIKEPAEDKRNWFDRKGGYYRLLWLIRRQRGGLVNEIDLPIIPAQQTVTAKVKLLPIRRGSIYFNQALIGMPEPLGLFKSYTKILLPQSLLVLPKSYPLPRQFILAGGRKLQPGGMTLASNLGDSREFVSLREYRSGDPIRHIHWKSWARLGKPIVKEYQEEYFQRFGLILDSFSGFEFDPIFEEAVSVAASFAKQLSTQEGLLDLMFIGQQAHHLTVGRGIDSSERVLQILAVAKTCQKHDITVLEALVIEHLPCLSACVVVLLQWDLARKQFVELLKRQNVSVLVLVLMAQQDIEMQQQQQSLNSSDCKIVPIHMATIAEDLMQL